MSAIRSTMFLGVAFFTVRIVMALVFGLILLVAFEEFRTVQTVLISLIIFNLGLGALTDIARTYLQPHYGNGVFGNVSAGQH